MSNAGGVRIDDLIDQAQTGVVESEAQIRLRVRVCTSEFGAVGGSVLGCVRVCTCCVCANYVHLLCGHKQSVATARKQFAGLAEVFRRLCVVAEHPKFVRGAAGIYPIRTWRSRHEGGSCAPSAQAPPERDLAKQHWPVLMSCCGVCVV